MGKGIMTSSCCACNLAECLVSFRLSPLQQAAIMGNLQALKTLLEAGTNVSQRDAKGRRAFKWEI